MAHRHYLKMENVSVNINPLTPELNPSA